jgi:DNA-binding MarR family transcriptional regulator
MRVIAEKETEHSLQSLQLFDGPFPSMAALDAVKAHPAFPDAMREISGSFAKLYRGDRVLNTVGTDRWRFLISVFAIHLHSDNPQRGLTAGRLRRLCADNKICSPGRASAMVNLMRSFGQLETVPNTEDRRELLLMPTERLMTWHRERFAVFFNGMAKVLPEGADALAALGSAAFLPRFISQLSRSFLVGFYYVDHIPDMKLFFERNSGMMVLYTLLQSAPAENAFPPTGAISVSHSAIGRQFGVSRVHVRRLLQDAVKQNLLARVGDKEDQFRVLPRLVEAFRHTIAMYIVHYAQCIRATLAEIEA